MYVRRNHRGYGRRRAGIGKKALWRRPTARNQRSQIVGLSRQIGKLRHRWTERTVRHHYSRNANLTLEGALAGGTGYIGVKMVQPTDWTNIFATTNAEGETNKTYLEKMQIQLRFFINNQPAPVTYNVFLVSLHRAAGTLDLNALQNNEHYMTMPTGNPESMENVFLNPKVFKTHRKRKFTLAQNPESATQPAQPANGYPPCSWKELKWNIYPKMTLKCYNGDWKTLQELDLPPTQRYYLIVFMNNSFKDYFNMAALTTLYTCKNMY